MPVKTFVDKFMVGWKATSKADGGSIKTLSVPMSGEKL